MNGLSFIIFRVQFRLDDLKEIRTLLYTMDVIPCELRARVRSAKVGMISVRKSSRGLSGICVFFLGVVL
jgi:hypothetical protein